jgi:hypothetical protein
MKVSKKRKVVCCVLILMFFTCLTVPESKADGPESVELGTIAQYYDPVQFDHEMHVGLIEENECAICHHHTLGTPVLDPICFRCHASSEETDSVACRDCHPAKRFNAEYLAFLEEDIHLFHVEKPGLQGAFHQRCLECHKKNDAPTGCQDCHVRTEEGDKFFHSGKYAPEQADKAAGH